MRNVFFYILATIFLLVSPGYCQSHADLVVVKKSQRKMFLLKNDKIIRQYHISLGGNPTGHKEQQGDQKTPEGNYILDYKKKNSSFYRAIHISYPDATDRKNAAKKKVNPGGQIMIHGQKNGFGKLAWITQRFDWTDGCIAVTNKEMAEIWSLVRVNTPIRIEK